MSLNQVILFGRLTANPEVRQTQNGLTVCNFTVAVDRHPKAKEADFINCQAWRSTAEFVGKHFTKGKPIVVVGSIRNNHYTDRNGVKHYSEVVQVDSVRFTISDSRETTQNAPHQAPVINPENYTSTTQAPHDGQNPWDTDDLDDFEEVLSSDGCPF